jgi:hypothetical protein
MNMLPNEAGADYNGSQKKPYPECTVLGCEAKKEKSRDMAGEEKILGQNNTHVEELDEWVLQANQPWRRVERHNIHGNHAGCDDKCIGLERHQKRPRASAESSNTQH